METRKIDHPGLKRGAHETKDKTSKLIPGLIMAIVVISLGANLFLLCDKTYVPRYFLVVNLITGISLISIVLLTLYSRKKLKGLQSDFIHRIFHKN